MPLADATQTQPPSHGSPATARPTSAVKAVRVVAPARLHLGFLDLNGALGRRFGSIGLAIDRPATELVLSHSRSFKAEGPDRRRALETLKCVAGSYAAGSAYQLDIRTAIPSHAGLGSGTQLALAIGAALDVLNGLDHSAIETGELMNRGARSAIGMETFERGGFIVDGGRGARDHAPPILMRADFPEAWRILLIIDPRTSGVHGEAEAKAFADLPPLSADAAGRLCRLVLMQLVPGLMEADIETFGAAISEIQAIIGGHFASAQGGSAWASPAVGRIARGLKERGAFGIGQSSWGPTGFAYTPSEEIAARLYDSAIEPARADGLEILIARGRNRGASIERIAGPDL
jgi:beta-ribofuranosylaminobenzene 5'-phosphate synthase